MGGPENERYSAFEESVTARSLAARVPKQCDFVKKVRLQGKISTEQL